MALLNPMEWMMKCLWKGRVATALLLCAIALSGHARELLPPNVAFPLTASRDDNGDVLLVFNVAPGYALYKERVNIEGARVARIEKPAGLPYQDEFFGKQEKYRGRTIIRVVPVNRNAPMSLRVQSQGCADVGVCYNPMRHVLNIP